jgi:ABC-type multidrug transport system ATPase subunit
MSGTDLLVEQQQARRLLGYLPQEFGFYPTFTAEQMLDYFARLKGVADGAERRALVGALLEMVNLSHARRQRLDDFSTGMKQRLGIAQALIGRPQLLIVDEPTAGLDPEERVRFHNVLAESAGTGCVVLLSTHIVSDVPNLCAQLAVIRDGEILASVTPREATEGLAGSVWEIDVPREEVAAFKARHRTISAQVIDGRTRLRVLSDGMTPGEQFRPAAATLEDYYFNVTHRVTPAD